MGGTLRFLPIEEVMAKVARPYKYRNGWRIKFTDEFGKRRSAFYFDYKDAERALLEKKNEVALIKEGRATRIEDKRFNELCEYWLQNVAPLKRAKKDQFSIIEKHLRPFFGDILLKEISLEHGQRYITSKDELTPKTVSNHLVVLISMLNFAKDMKWLLEVPKIRKPKVVKNSKAFLYLKTDEEIERFLKTARTFGENYFVLYLTAIFTGMREGELAALRWEHIDFASRFITVENSFKNDTTKSGKMRRVPILDVLYNALVKWRETKINEVVFPSTKGTMLYPSARIFQERFKEILDCAGFPKHSLRDKEKHYIRFHDLRHTFASHWMMKGGDIYRLQEVLGHQSVEMTQIYAHLSPHIYKQDYSRFNSISISL